MAAMSYEMARAAAEKLIQSGRANGLTREALISQIIAGAPAAGEAPQGAIASALMPQPRVLTAATPAQMQPEPLVAPKPVAPAQPQAEAMPAQEAEPQPAAATPRPSRFRPMLEAAKAQLVEMQTAMSGAAANKQPVSMADKVRFDTQKDVVRELEQRALAEEGAAAPEEMLAALAKREERLNRREELLKESKARSPWEALLAGGAAATEARRGENFGAVLSRGLQAGFQNYERSRRENIAGVEALGEARDETALKRYELTEKAREGASNLIDTQSTMQQRAITMRNNLLKSGVDAATADATVRTAIANANRAEFEAKNAGRVLEAELGVKGAQAEYYRRRPGGDEPKVNVEKRADRDVLDAAAADYEAKRALYDEAMRDAKGDARLISSDVKADFITANAKIRQMSDVYKSKYGSTPYIGTKPTTAKPAAPPVAGARKAPDGKYYVPDPKRPGKYLQVG